MNEIIQFAQDHGIEINEIVPDSKIHRFQISRDDHKKSGWYVGFQNHLVKTGEIYYVVVFGNYRTGETITYKNESIKVTREDKKILNSQLTKAKEEADSQRLKIQSEVSIDAEIKWNGLSSEGESEYLQRKMIDKCPEMGIKYCEEAIYVPVRDINGKLWSMQKVFHAGDKRFFPGGRMQGNFHTIGDLNKADTVRVTEGFATGSSIYMATSECVIVAFNAGNLVSVTKQLKEMYPDKSFIICGDDDQFKDKNAGREKAEEAAKASLGKTVYPKFKSLETKPTDFNDLHVIEGIETLKEQLKGVSAPKMALYALGFKEREYFFTSSSNRQIVPVTSFTEDAFLNLMPLSYWEALYPGQKESSVNWTRAKTELMEKCRDRGLFNGFNVRGAGVWMDAGRIVVNMGDHLIVNGEKIALGGIRSKYFYSLGMNLIELHDRPLDISECHHLISACNNFQWTKKDSGILLAGALVLSRVCGALPVRPHVWVTGGAETGKTTLLEKLISKIIGVNALYVSRGTTEAGVRQALKSNSLPVLFDEFETTNTRGDEQIDALIELMRGAWSDSHAKIVKGGATGNAVEYAARFSAIVSSIRTKLINDADKGRFTVVELRPHGGDQDHWKILKGYLHEITEEYSDRLFSRTIKLLPIILENQRVIQSVLAKKSGSRFGDQYGMILAGYASLVYDSVMTEDEAEWLSDQVSLEEEKENTKQSDHEDCLRHLWTTSISYDHSSGRVNETIGSIIDEIQRSLAVGPTNYDSFKMKALNTIGIRVFNDSIAIVATGHAGLQKTLANTKWKDNWGVSLKRLPGAEKKKIRIDSQPFWAIIIPSTAIYAGN